MSVLTGSAALRRRVAALRSRLDAEPMGSLAVAGLQSEFEGAAEALHLVRFVAGEIDGDGSELWELSADRLDELACRLERYGHSEGARNVRAVRAYLERPR